MMPPMLQPCTPPSPLPSSLMGCTVSGLAPAEEDRLRGAGQVLH